MEVNIKQALKMFFSKSSFEMIYFEAFANALDANATEFTINISLSDYGELQNLVVTLSDNGVGFDDVRFGKFSKLFDVDEQSHKGLGRLVYLCYFDKVQIKSVFDNSKQRVWFLNYQQIFIYPITISFQVSQYRSYIRCRKKLLEFCVHSII